MASVMYDCANLNHTIDKVAKWMVTSDSQVCLFADDTSHSILSSPSTNSVGEQGKQVLIDRLKSDAVSRMKSLLRSTANQENNHNEFKKKSCHQRATVVDSCSSDSPGASPNRNQNNRHGTGESEHRRKTTHSDSRHRRQSQPSNSHMVSEQRKDSGDGSGGFKDDKYLERIVDRATQEIRSAIYKLSAENKLPERCHLKMKLSIKPQRSVNDASSPKEHQGQRRHRGVGGGTGGSRGEDEGRHRASNSGRHRTSERDGGGRSDREKRATSASNKREHHEQRKDKRKN